jgi:hypothetical protein
VAKHKKTVPQFFEMCNKVVDAAPQVSAFIDILNASSEFKVFVVSGYSFAVQPASLSARGPRS